MSDDRNAPETRELRGTRARRADADRTPAPAPAPAEPVQPPLDADLEKSDDRKPEDELLKMKTQRALAEANKPIEPAAEAIWSSEPDKVKARTAIEDAYRAAARGGSSQAPEGELHARYRIADEKFVEAAADMLRSREHKKESRLAAWITTYLGNGKDPKVRTILRDRKQVEDRLKSRLGPREQARQEAVDKTKNWEKAFGRWSAPDKEIGAQIASYTDRINQLNADINTATNRDQAIFSFWFEVAPAHLQLRADPVSPENTPGVSLITDALGEFQDLLPNFQSGKQRDDGSLYLIDPDELPAHRRQILNRWQDAAEEQADAEAAYGTRPDAAADLKPRHDKARVDGWVKGTRDALATPKA